MLRRSRTVWLPGPAGNHVTPHALVAFLGRAAVVEIATV
jgi:hypothetical protein